jgi:type I restriction enzyme S subunit
MQKYPVYKDSGVEWLGEIPEHWEILPGLSFIFENKDRNKGMIRNTILSLSYGNIRVKGEDELTGLVPESFETYQFVNKGDLIFRPTDLQNDTVSLRSSISEYEGIITNAYLNLRFNSKANSKFFHYFFRAIDNNKVIYGLGSGLRQNISYLNFRRFNFPFPPLTEQTAIAAFLDRKTALIDQAIAIKQKQIELLKERRQILIHNAVTRGLNPNVKMKDSGVEWIGEIPEGWNILTKMKYISSLKGRQGWQGLKAEEYKDEGPHVLSSAHFNNYIIDWDKCPRVSIERYLMDKHIQLEIGDILLMKDGANMGKLALVENLPGLACLNSHLLLFRSLCENGVSFYFPKFMFYHMMCQEFQDYVKINGTGSTFLGISQESIGNYPICLPTLEEQIVIAKFLDERSSKFDQAITLKEQEIEMLKEYKATLINSTVTGKIKVC